MRRSSSFRHFGSAYAKLHMPNVVRSFFSASASCPLYRFVHTWLICSCAHILFLDLPQVVSLAICNQHLTSSASRFPMES